MIYFYHERWPVFYEDNHLLVVYKPAGLIMQRDHKDKVNLLDLAKLWIKARYNKPGNVYLGMVHRLDGPVAGVVVFARTSKAASRLSRQFREGKIEKHYLAVVEGRPPENQDKLENYLVRQGRKSRIVSVETSDSRKACLQYRVLIAGMRASVLAIRLETGRRHQIRVQLADIGCPVLGDVNYGATNAMSYGRIALMARMLVFDHPTTNARMTFKSPIPQGWPMSFEKYDSNGLLWAIENYEKKGLVLPHVTRNR